MRGVTPDVVEQRAQPAAGDAATRSVLGHPMGLLGDVRQVEEGGEGAYQVGGVANVEPRQQHVQLGAGAVAGARIAGLFAQTAHPLHQFQERGAVLPHQRLPQQVAEQPNVSPQRRVPGDATPTVVVGR